MFLFRIASAALPLAATADEIQPWMIAAIAAGAVLALILIVVAARKARGPKGEDIREAMEAARMEAVGNAEGAADYIPGSDIPVAPVPASPASASAKNSGKGKHAR